MYQTCEVSSYVTVNFIPRHWAERCVSAAWYVVTVRMEREELGWLLEVSVMVAGY